MVCYLGVEVLAIVLFWAMYFASPAWRGWIVPAGMDKVFGAFALSDVALLVPLAVVGAGAILKRSRSAWTWLVMHCGAAVYATLWTLAAAWMDAGWTISAVLMLPMMFASIGIVLLLRTEETP